MPRPKKSTKATKTIKKKTASSLKKSSKKKTVKKTTSKRKSTKVSAVPKGHNNITPYLIVDGAAKAIDFYKNVFGAKEKMRMQHESGRVGHAELQIGDTKIMLSDEWPEMNVYGPIKVGGSPVLIHLYVKKVDDTVERAAASGARIVRPPQDMFYGDRSANLEDPFGHKWCVATHIEDVTPVQIRKRAASSKKYS
ncbi:MAG: VOC family protein [Gammaproteobacteria bacterium]